MAGLEDSVRYLKGVGEQRAKALEKLGIRTVRELLNFFPRTYEDRSIVRELGSIRDGEQVCVHAILASPPQMQFLRSGRRLLSCTIADDTGEAEVGFFNMPYLLGKLRSGETYSFYGRFTRLGSRLSVTNPIFEPVAQAKKTGQIVPVYRLRAGLDQKKLSSAVAAALAQNAAQLPQLLPEGLEEAYGFTDCRTAYHDIHFPPDWGALERARERLVFEELFTLACALQGIHRRRKTGPARVIPTPELSDFISVLPFALTGAQQRAISEALGDLSSGRCMNRLVQGDVGSGKTMVAAACIWAAAKAGMQSAFMAPTELLADQHTNTLAELLAPFDIRVVRLKGGLSAKERRAALEQLADGEALLAVGTHALFSKNVRFARLGLVITDEQHRFGVVQRAALAEKGESPHVLVMSATPIPRTLALMMYGDLDVSVLDELPPGRRRINTYAVGEEMRERIERFIAKLVGEGRQVYVVCPLIGDEEEPEPEVASAVGLFQRLSEQVFPQLRVRLLHGRMKPAEKELVMASFAAGEADILVSTSVIEVGVDVPNAALMVIENAERFGLSQLHQLRGRVGRGRHQSYCVLFASPHAASQSRDRLRLLTRLYDGFRLAEEDLKLRGPGDFFGTQQSGLPPLHIADLTTSLDTLLAAQKEADKLLREDPELQSLEALRERVNALLRGLDA